MNNKKNQSEAAGTNRSAVKNNANPAGKICATLADASVGGDAVTSAHADIRTETYSAMSIFDNNTGTSASTPSITANITTITEATAGTYGGGKEDILELLELLKHPSPSNFQRFRFGQ